MSNCYIGISRCETDPSTLCYSAISNLQLAIVGEDSYPCYVTIADNGVGFDNRALRNFRVLHVSERYGANTKVSQKIAALDYYGRGIAR